MNKNISIQLKAIFLLVVFGLNTVVGFACAVGVNMGFNSSDHHDAKITEVHVHESGEKHNHHKESPSHSQKHKDKKDDCCNDSATKLSQADKAVPQSIKIFDPLFLTAFIASYYSVDISYPSQVTGSTKYFAQSYHPPIPDIRIAIQSFQI